MDSTAACRKQSVLNSTATAPAQAQAGAGQPGHSSCFQTNWATPGLFQTKPATLGQTAHSRLTGPNVLTSRR